MTSIPAAGGNTNVDQSAGFTSNSLGDVDVDEFMNLLITELQNQDPLDPMDNAAMLNQIGQIREIAANNKLTDTLTNLSVGQELTMAAGLIGKTVKALDNNAKAVEGVVDSVAVETDEKDPTIRSVSVHIGSSIVDMKNIREIVEN